MLLIHFRDTESLLVIIGTFDPFVGRRLREWRGKQRRTAASEV
jgi:hypothetical protein